MKCLKPFQIECLPCIEEI